MKKSIIMIVAATGMLFATCGSSDDDKKEENKKAKKCENYNGIMVDCADLDQLDKIEEISRDFIRLGIGDGYDYAKAIETNEAILKKLEEYTPVIKRLLEADPAEKESYWYDAIQSAKTNTETYKQILVDLQNITISAAWEQDPKFEDEMDEIIRFKNNSQSVIDYMGGTMAYYDAEGNVIKEDVIGLYAFHFEPEAKDGLPAGYEGISDHGLNIDKERRADIDSIAITIQEIRYPDPEDK